VLSVLFYLFIYFSLRSHSTLVNLAALDFSVQTVLDRALRGEETANFEFPLMTKAGARIEILLNATTRKDEHGKVIGVVGIGQDITGELEIWSRLIDLSRYFAPLSNQWSPNTCPSFKICPENV